ncbi:MAG: hypothetical protein ABWY06_02605 [Pseudomonas sp.]|uniref:hypothetical protein n=1 Tax=Pseudomonas sp. TaxID=306 RepID=UPI00339531F6
MAFLSWLDAAPRWWLSSCALFSAGLGAAPLQWRAEHCAPLPAAFELPASWAAYRGAARLCEVPGPVGDMAPPRLLTVFEQQYYSGQPADAAWQSFPRPRLLDAKGNCLAQLPLLFPLESPEVLEVEMDRFQRGWPQRIGLQVRSPTVSGDYRLPSLHWQPGPHAYRPGPEADDEYRHRVACAQE